MKLEQVRELKKELLLLNEEETSNSAYGLNKGMVAIEIPQHVIKDWGIRVSNPHITVLYFPYTNLFNQNRVARMIQKELLGLNPFEVTTRGQEWFGPEKDVRVALVQPALELTEMRLKIYSMIDSQFPGMIDKKYPVYRPHITIGKSGDGLDGCNTDKTFTVDTIIIQLKDKETYKVRLF